MMNYSIFYILTEYFMEKQGIPKKKLDFFMFFYVFLLLIF